LGEAVADLDKRLPTGVRVFCSRRIAVGDRLERYPRPWMPPGGWEAAEV